MACLQRRGTAELRADFNNCVMAINAYHTGTLPAGLLSEATASAEDIQQT